MPIIVQIREWQKTFPTLSGFYFGVGVGGFGIYPIKKENIFFSDNVEWSSKKLWKMISPEKKADVKQQQIKELVAVSCNFL